MGRYHGAKLSRKKEMTPYELTRTGSEERRESWNYPILTLDGIDFSRTKRNSSTKLTFDDLRGADLRGAVLRKATPKDADESPEEFRTEVDRAKIRGKFPAGLMETDLSGANLRGADLREADLSGAVGITNEELEQQADSLKGATMPD